MGPGHRHLARAYVADDATILRLIDFASRAQSMLQCILLAHADKSQIVFLNVSRPRRTCTYLPPRAFARFGEDCVAKLFVALRERNKSNAPERFFESMLRVCVQVRSE